MVDYSAILQQLQTTIQQRRDGDPQQSYIASLFQSGRKKIAQKVAEEGVEVALAAVSEGSQDIISESADLFFHLFVLYEETGISFDDVLLEIQRREGMSGLAEKASRSS